MVFKEARECADKIILGLMNIRRLVVELHDKKGWVALKYKNWTACVKGEFKQSERYVFFQYRSAVIEQNVSNCTMVQLGTIPERQLRPLVCLSPEQQRNAWQRSIATAPNGKMTAAHVAKVVREMI